jgi:hypothetical protein
MIKSYCVKAANIPTVITPYDRVMNTERCWNDNLQGKSD